MEVGSIAILATSIAVERTGQSVAVAVLKKALDAQASGAMALINAIPMPQDLPSNLGQNVNTRA